MNLYLYPVLDENCIAIKKCMANSRNHCEEKIKSIYVQNYDVDDTQEFDNFCEDLCDKYDVLIGDIYEIDEFM